MAQLNCSPYFVAGFTTLSSLCWIFWGDPNILIRFAFTIELELTYLFFLFILFYFSFSIRDKTGEALKLLLSQGFDPNVQDSEKRISPLHLAVHHSNEMAVRILTQYAACDVNLQVCVIGAASLESLNCAASSCQFYSYLNVFWLPNSVQILDSYKVCSFHFYILLNCY